MPEKIALLVGFSLFYFGIVFNFKLNEYRGKDPLYVGIDDKHDSWIDHIFCKLPHPGVWLLTCEVCGVILTAAFYLHITR